jgi:glucose 1-dehydrogenase
MEVQRGSDQMQLENKTAIVTGGNSGIGEAIVKRLSQEGANVVIDYVARPDDTADLVKDITSAGGKAIGVEADVSKPAEIQKLIDAAVREYGRLDVMVNNAGIEKRHSLLEADEDSFDTVMAVDMKSAFFGTQLAAKQFVSQGGGGVIVNVSSVHEDWPMPGNISYCVAKGGMRMLTRTAGVELGPQGIRVVNVAPGAVATPINTQTLNDPEQRKKLEDAIPLGKVADPAEIGEAVLFVASDAGRYVTATTLVVDGGIMQSSVGL